MPKEDESGNQEIETIRLELEKQKIERIDLIHNAVKRINKKNLKHLISKLKMGNEVKLLDKHRYEEDMEVLRNAQNYPQEFNLWEEFLYLFGLKRRVIEIKLNSFLILYANCLTRQLI